MADQTTAVAADEPGPWPTATCDDCGKQIIWATTRNLRAMPVDPNPSPDGNVALRPGHDGRPRADVIGNPADRFGRSLHMPHHPTCKRQPPRRRTR